MTIPETVGVFVGIPAAIYGAIASLVLLPGLVRRPRYRPGQPWSHEPVWYCPHPQALDPETRALVGGPLQPTLTAREHAALPPGSGQAPDHPSGGVAGPAAVLDIPASTARGGAHGDW